MIVYHYCSMDVFMKIISGKSIRLSDITKSNDSMEILWITKHIRDVFAEAFQKECGKTKFFREGCQESEFMDLVEQYSNEFFKQDKRVHSYLVCCFSKKGDLLSQWRGYADDAKGVSVGFEDEIIKSLSKPGKDGKDVENPFQYGKAVYSESMQKSRIRKCAKKLISELKKIIKLKNVDEDEREKKIMDIFYSCFTQLFKLSIMMKNPFFKEENEYRLSYRIDIKPRNKITDEYGDKDLHISGLTYHNSSNDLIPHIDLMFGSNPQIIKEVIIGPRCRARIEDIEEFLEQNGIHCEVKLSQGTYR